MAQSRFPNSELPRQRLRPLNQHPARPTGDYVLYWMVGHRRTRFNFALERAVECANAWRKPLLVFEPLRCDYQWACLRHHRFVVEGMAANAEAIAPSRAALLTYIERRPGEGRGLLQTLAKRACAVITDDAPVFFLQRMTEAAAQAIELGFEAVDSNGLLPLRTTDKVFARAYDLRRYLQRSLPPHLLETPAPEPLSALETRWPNTLHVSELVTRAAHRRGIRCSNDLADIDALLDSIELDKSIGAGAVRGGSEAASSLLDEFLEGKLQRYQADRNNLDQRATSELSPHLHYGHISTHEILARLAELEGWTPLHLEEGGRGQRLGWWQVSEAAETFLDELVTWRELGLNMAWHNEAYTEYDSLPEWARRTLAEHRNDQRPTLYSLDELDAAETHDEVWNAAQRELKEDGRIHNYLRMLWGKKVLEWSPTPRIAAEVLVELNNRYSLDGRDPNSYSGIYWCLGRYDRAWGPERPIFGKIRYMSSDNTRRKLKLKGYLERYGPEQARPQRLF